MMEHLKELILYVQEQLSISRAFAMVEKDWGQLHYTPLPVKYPCALVDIDNVNYTELGRGLMLVEADLVVTVITMRLQPGSMRGPKPGEMSVFGLLSSVHNTLQLSHPTWSAPFVRRTLRKVYLDNTYEVYALTYSTTYKENN